MIYPAPRGARPEIALLPGRKAPLCKGGRLLHGRGSGRPAPAGRL